MVVPLMRKAKQSNSARLCSLVTCMDPTGQEVVGPRGRSRRGEKTALLRIACHSLLTELSLFSYFVEISKQIHLKSLHSYLRIYPGNLLLLSFNPENLQANATGFTGSNSFPSKTFGIFFLRHWNWYQELFPKNKSGLITATSQTNLLSLPQVHFNYLRHSARQISLETEF
jgi:hypothetical protein